MKGLLPSDEVDVREILRVIREESSDQPEEAEESLGFESADIEVMRTHYNIREYQLTTDRRLGPIVLGMKKIVESVVKPYAGHFLDKQTHYNAAMSRIVTRAISRLDGLHDQLLEVRNEQKETHQTIRDEMSDVRARLGTLREEMAERHDELHRLLASSVDNQARLSGEREATRIDLEGRIEQTRDDLRMASGQLEKVLVDMVLNLNARLDEVEKKRSHAPREKEGAASMQTEDFFTLQHVALLQQRLDRVYRLLKEAKPFSSNSRANRSSEASAILIRSSLGSGRSTEGRVGPAIVAHGWFSPTDPTLQLSRKLSAMVEDVREEVKAMKGVIGWLDKRVSGPISIENSRERLVELEVALGSVHRQGEIRDKALSDLAVRLGELENRI